MTPPRTHLSLLGVFAMIALTPALHAQQSPAAQPAASVPASPPVDLKALRSGACANPKPENFRTFYLHHMTQQSEANELFTALRQMEPPDVKSFFVPSQMAIQLCGLPENIALAERILADLDRPKKAYRITYTLTEVDGIRRGTPQHYSLVVSPGQNSVLKLGSRIPFATGSLSDKASTQTQISYVDVGMNFDVALDETAEGIRLRTSAEQSSIADDKSGVGPQDPVLRQALFKGTSYLAPGKPLRLGSLDIPDTTRHLEIEVLMEPLP